MIYRNKKILRAAKGADCQFQGPDCNGDRETVVFCHLDEMFAGKGTGIKGHDFAGFFGCYKCHAYYHNKPPQSTDWLALRAMTRTILILFEKGIIS